MRFITITDSMIEAIFEFVMEQNADNSVQDFNIDCMVTTAFEELGKVHGVLPVTAIHRYNFNVRGGDSDYLFPAEIEDDGVLYKNMVHIGTFRLDEYDPDEDTDKLITSGYDVIYDLDSCSIKVLYRVEVSDDEITSVYRVETEKFEELYASEFIVSLAVQLSEKLRDGAEYIRRVCDRI